MLELPDLNIELKHCKVLWILTSYNSDVLEKLRISFILLRPKVLLQNYMLSKLNLRPSDEQDMMHCM